jgi:uncharacterized membrane protein
MEQKGARVGPLSIFGRDFESLGRLACDAIHRNPGKAARKHLLPRWFACAVIPHLLPAAVAIMEPGLTLLVIVLVVLFLAAPILAIVAIVRSSSLRNTVEQIPKLISRVYDLERKLDALDHGLRTSASAPVETPPHGQPVPPPAVQREPAPVVTPPAAPPPPRVTPPPAPRVTPPVRTEPSHVPFAVSSTYSSARPAAETDVETMIAGRWLYYVGILALAVAMTFFLKYAFDNNWIGPAGRVGIGLLIGSGLFPLSHWILERGFKYFSEGLAGLGAAILYLSIWAGWHYYHLFAQSTAFALMIVVTVFTVAVAIGRNSERIAVLAVIGGALTPGLVSTGRNEEVALFTYLAVLGAGMLGIAWKRNWKSLPPTMFVATLIYFWGWYSEFYNASELWTTILFATIFFVLFGALPAIRSTRDGELPVTEVALVLGNAFQFLIALRLMLWPEYRWGLTLAVLALSAVHLLAERALPSKQSQANQLARALYAGLALVFATVAIPIRLDGHWITIAWAVEGTVLIASGFRIASRALRISGFVMFAIVATRLFVHPVDAGPTFLLNARFLTLAVCAASFFAAYWIAQRSPVVLNETESKIYIALAIAASLCFLVAISWDVWDWVGRMPSLGIDRGRAQELALSVLWLIYSLALMVPGAVRKSAVLRWQALALLGVTVVKVFFFDLSFLTGFYRIVSFFVLGLLLLMVSFFYQRRQDGTRTAKK